MDFYYTRLLDFFAILIVTLSERIDNSVLGFGGGHGLPGFIDALHYSNRSVSLVGVVAMSDNGGATKMMRWDARGNMVAFRDGISSILAMVHPEDRDLPAYLTWSDMLTNRDENERVLGDQILGKLFTTKDGFGNVENHLKNCGVPLRGTVLPSSSHPSHIVYTTETENTYTGEEMNDYHRMSYDKITRIRLRPALSNSPDPVPGFPAAIESIHGAKAMFIAPGTTHASIYSVFAAEGMKLAMQVSKGYFVHVTNLVGTNVDGTNDATPMQLVEMDEEYTGIRPNGMLIPNMSRDEFESRYKTAAYLYWKREQAKFIGWEPDSPEIKDVEREGITIYRHDATAVIEANKYTWVIRHKPELLAKPVGKILDSVLASK